MPMRWVPVSRWVLAGRAGRRSSTSPCRTGRIQTQCCARSRPFDFWLSSRTRRTTTGRNSVRDPPILVVHVPLTRHSRTPAAMAVKLPELQAASMGWTTVDSPPRPRTSPTKVAGTAHWHSAPATDRRRRGASSCIRMAFPNHVAWWRGRCQLVNVRAVASLSGRELVLRSGESTSVEGDDDLWLG